MYDDFFVRVEVFFMKLLILSTTLLLVTDVLAVQKAVTEEGEVVLLRDDGTWSYENKPVPELVELTMNPDEFKKSPAANFSLKSSITNLNFWIDPKQWSFKKADENGAAEYDLSLKGGDLYGMVISEQLEVGVETLADVAFENAQEAGSDMRIVNKEYRMVNGLKVIYMEMEGTIQGIKFTYFGHYYSDSSGSVQFLAYTGTSLAQKYESEINQYLNGIALK